MDFGPYDLHSFLSGAAVMGCVGLIGFVAWVRFIGRR